ncbi:MULTISPECIES: nucleotidyltransferase family protein [unclassified Ectothiorhodospira]|uniref:nucleotidyltransferase family protein n=1 Tax=unclassified Ectothiorhodospira TaxID=2684909 RepID=UPI001EE98505|nr:MULTISPECIES: nucleotidyltransferase family protein [unclassified Ectothiorhodospira]MCG5516951.1 nucleotidyltransferase family protein [Ectothiorhodospira sp. 9100]MCG5519869.1 nucleotidyltransferase family protein [Ectothiorhodospira sp. 9905]
MKPSAALQTYRDLIRQVVLSHRACNPRVFGSVLYGEDSEDSDLDLLVDTMPDTSLLDLAQIQVELEAQLGVSVDILTPAALPAHFRKQVLDEARSI